MRQRVSIIAFLAVIVAAINGHAILPLRDQWSAANRALAQNQSEAALQLLREFNDWYADEEVTRDPGFREKLIRLWGLAALQSGSLEEGIDQLETWLEAFPEAKNYRAFIRFQLASAHLAQGNAISARAHWSMFIAEHPELPECLLVRWLWAESCLSESNFTEAIWQLEEIARSDALEGSGRTLAQSALALALLSQGQVERAIRQLVFTDMSLAGRLWKAVMAPSLADALLRNNKPELALQASEWFDSNQNLLGQMKLLQRGHGHHHVSIRARIWGHHWQNQMLKAEASLQSTIEAGFGLNKLYLLKLRTCIEAGSASSAFHLASMLLQSTTGACIVQREMVYSYAIEACMLSEKWNHASRLAQSFLQEYPGSPELPRILFLQARCAALRKDWPDALHSITRLMAAFPKNRAIHAWRFARIKWLSEAGHPADALDEIKAFKGNCPASWMDYLQLEQANCLNKLHRTSDAQSLYHLLAENSRYPAVAEQATIAQLKISLNELNLEAFKSHHSRFMERFPHSQSVAMVDLLMGTFMELSNDLENAIRIYEKVGGSEGPMADHARQQLSRLFTTMGADKRLHTHAMRWIQINRNSPDTTSPQPWMDLLQVQRLSGTPALGKSQFQIFLDQLLENSPVVPCSPFLDLVENQWVEYSRHIGIQQQFVDWMKTLVTEKFASGNTASWAKLALYQADILMRQGRIDSADGIRIRVLTTASLDDLDQSGLFEAASVAHKYDFPESVDILEHFLDLYDDAPMTPECLLMLAKESEMAGNTDKAISRLKLITVDWRDSEILIDALRRLARLLYEERRLQPARQELDSILQYPGISPHVTAETLLLRAKIDYQLGELETSRLSCERILTLYPDINEFANPARELRTALNEA